MDKAEGKKTSAEKGVIKADLVSNDIDESGGLFLHPKSKIALVIVLERQNPRLFNNQD
ncbi:MAG TPA: hypothetical protein V6C90_26885 [Coleofasciculaceae cyanobacterium]